MQDIWFQGLSVQPALFLLAVPRVDPSSNDNLAINVAIGEGNTEIVRLLLKDPRVNPAANFNEPICKAVKNGNIETVKLLLADPRVSQ